MIFNKPIQEIIQNRKSKRNYLDKKIETAKLEKIKAFLEESSTKNYEFTIADTFAKKQKLGTYGMIKGSKVFIVSLMKKNFKDITKFGYDFEKIILFCTSLDISTCWLAGTFNRKHFSNAITLEDEFFIPIVSPIGYSPENEGFLRNLIRKQGNFDKRKNWESIFFEKNINSPLNKEINSNYKKALDMLRISPSASNKQPWIVIKDNNDYDFYLNRTPNYAKSLKFDVQKNDIGIAMCHFEITLNELGIHGNFIDKNKTINSLEYIKTWNEV